MRHYFFAAYALPLLLGACAFEDRPAWEKAALMRSPPPPANAGRSAASGTAAVRTETLQLPAGPRQLRKTSKVDGAESASPDAPVKARATALQTTPMSTEGWAQAEVVTYRYSIPLAPGAPPGRYRIEIGL